MLELGRDKCQLTAILASQAFTAAVDAIGFLLIALAPSLSTRHTPGPHSLACKALRHVMDRQGLS